MKRFALCLGTFLLIGSPLFAMGRKSDYSDKTIYDTEPVQRGSPANPNPAFAPPRFDDESNLPTTPQVAPPRSSVETTSNDQAPAPARSTSSQSPDASEPPLP